MARMGFLVDPKNATAARRQHRKITIPAGARQNLRTEWPGMDRKGIQH